MEKPKKQLDVAPDSESTAISPNFSYVHTIPALLKIIEFLLCLFAFALAASFKNGMNSRFLNLGWGRANFFIFIMVIAWLGCIVLFLVYFLNIISRLKKINHIFLLLSVIHFIGAIFVLISTALVLDDVLTLRGQKAGYRDSSLCSHISKVTNTSCSAYEGSGAAGIFSFVAIVFDGVLHAMKGVQEYRIQQAEREESSEEPEITPGLYQAQMAPGIHQQNEMNTSYEPEDNA